MHNIKEELEECKPNDNDKGDNKHKKGDKSQRKIYFIDTSQQEVGNVFDDTTIFFFEYAVSEDKINQFNELKHLPFQKNTYII